MHFAAKFVEAEVIDLLKEFELNPHEKQLLVALAGRIIAAYEEYRYLMEGKQPAKLHLE